MTLFPELAELRDLLQGRRVLTVCDHALPEEGCFPSMTTEMVELRLDDGTVFVLHDGHGFPPFISVIRQAYREPQLWEGDNG